MQGDQFHWKNFRQAIQERESNYILNFNRQPGDREMVTIRQQAWEMFIMRHAIEKQIDKTGVTQVTVDEIEDMIRGKNVNESMKQAFTESRKQDNSIHNK